jgi:hypothetical protein
MKSLFKIVVVLVLLAAIAVVAAGFFIGPIIVKAVDTIGPRVTGTAVTLDAAKVMPLSGGGTLAGFFVGNPKGWAGDKAIYVGELRASVRPLSLLEECIEVTEVFIDSPEFVFEKSLTGGSNIESLLKQIEENTGGGTRPPGAAETGAPAKPIKFSVKSFRLQNAKMTLMVAGQALTVPLPALTITDLGVAEGGITADQVASKVLKRVLAQMIPVAADALKKVGLGVLGGAADGVTGATKGVGDATKGVFNKLLGK